MLGDQRGLESAQDQAVAWVLEFTLQLAQHRARLLGRGLVADKLHDDHGVEAEGNPAQGPLQDYRFD